MSDAVGSFEGAGDEEGSEKGKMAPDGCGVGEKAGVGAFEFVEGLFDVAQNQELNGGAGWRGRGIGRGRGGGRSAALPFRGDGVVRSKHIDNKFDDEAIIEKGHILYFIENDEVKEGNGLTRRYISVDTVLHLNVVVSQLGIVSDGEAMIGMNREMGEGGVPMTRLLLNLFAKHRVVRNLQNVFIAMQPFFSSHQDNGRFATSSDSIHDDIVPL